MKKRFLPLLLLSSLSLMTAACDSEGSDSEGDSGSAASMSCYSQCQAQEDAGCGIGLETCQELCDILLDGLDADCTAKAQASFDCNVANDEVCGVVTMCEAEAEAYAACLEGGTTGQ